MIMQSQFYKKSVLVFCLLIMIVLSLTSVAQAQIDYGFYGVESIAWSPDGTMFAVGGGTPICNPHDISSFAIEIRDATTSAVIRRLTGHDCSVTTLAWSPDGTRIASGIGTFLNLTKIWDVATGQVIVELAGSNIGMNSLSWNPEGTLIAGVLLPGRPVGQVNIWNAITGAFFSPESLDGGTPETAVSQMQWSPDGTLIATARAAGDVVNIWDANTFALVNTYEVNHSNFISSLKWSPDGNFIATGDIDGRIVISNVNNRSTISFASLSWIEELDWSPDGDYIASGSSESGVEIWNPTTGELLETLSYEGIVLSVAWSPDGCQIAYGGFRLEQAMEIMVSMPSIVNPPEDTNFIPACQYAAE